MEGEASDSSREARLRERRKQRLMQKKCDREELITGIRREPAPMKQQENQEQDNSKEQLERQAEFHSSEKT